MEDSLQKIEVCAQSPVAISAASAKLEKALDFWVALCQASNNKGKPAQHLNRPSNSLANVPNLTRKEGLLIEADAIMQSVFQKKISAQGQILLKFKASAETEV